MASTKMCLASLTLRHETPLQSQMLSNVDRILPHPTSNRSQNLCSEGSCVAMMYTYVLVLEQLSLVETRCPIEGPLEGSVLSITRIREIIARFAAQMGP